MTNEALEQAIWVTDNKLKLARRSLKREQNRHARQEDEWHIDQLESRLRYLNSLTPDDAPTEADNEEAA